MVGSSGDYWNLVDGNPIGTGYGNVGAVPPGETLLNSASGAAGLAGNAKVTWTSDGLFNSTTGAFGTPSYFTPGNLANLMDSYLTNTNGSKTVSFSGLLANTNYELIAISQGNGPVGDQGIQLSSVTATPEPSSIWLGIGGMATLLGWQRRRRNA